MVSAFDDTGDEMALTEVQFTLNVFCSQEGTMNVTSNDLELDQACPDIRPIGNYTIPSIPPDLQDIEHLRSDHGTWTPVWQAQR